MLRLHRVLGVAIAGAGLIAVSPVAPSAAEASVHAVQLTAGGGAAPLGEGTAFVMGPSGFPVPVQRYVDAADTLYLQPNGFGGDAQGLFTPEGLYPVTGVKSLPIDTSTAQGEQILYSTIMGQINGGDVDADHPVVVFGFSQSSNISSLVMSQLAEQGVPTEDVRFVLVGDPSNPNGGLEVTADTATPSNLYPTDIYTNEYDGFADFPRYPINVLSDLNAVLGILYQHATYAVLTPEQIASAVQLPTSMADTLTNYYMIPAETLPLLAPLQLLPVIGQPLYDLLEPDMRILVNLGYGSIEHGWAPGPADVVTDPAGLFPTDLDWSEVLTALGNGMKQGIQAATNDLLDPDTYQIVPAVDNPSLSGLVDAAYTMGLVDDPDASLWELGEGALSRFANFPISDVTLASPPIDIINDLTATFAADYATLLPLADGITEALSGNIFDAFLGPVAVLEAATGTMVNLANLFSI
jgi:hypothetical protein